MCSTLATVSLTIAATRIQRGLLDYASNDTEQYDIIPSHSPLRLHRCRRLFNPSQEHGRPRHQERKANRVSIARTNLSRMEVAIPMYEQDEVPKIIQDGSEHSLIEVERQLYGMHPGKPRVDENGVGSPTTAGKSEYST